MQVAAAVKFDQDSKALNLPAPVVKGAGLSAPPLAYYPNRGSSSRSGGGLSARIVKLNPVNAAAFAGKARRAHGVNPRQNPAGPACLHNPAAVPVKDAPPGVVIMRAFSVSHGNATHQ